MAPSGVNNDHIERMPCLASMVPLLAARTWLPQQEEAFVLGTCIAIYGAIFLMWILIAVWVYRDAKERGMEAGIWVLIVLLIGVIGLVVYFIVRSDKPKYPQAPVAYPPPPPPYGTEYGSFEQVPTEAPHEPVVSSEPKGPSVGERMDRVPLLNKVPSSLRVLVIVIIVVVILTSVSAVMFMSLIEKGLTDGGDGINPAKLDDFSWSSGPVQGSASEFSETVMTLDSVIGQNQTVLVDMIVMELEWQDEPDQTWAGRVRENSADSFQLMIDLGEGYYQVGSEMVPNDEGSKVGSVSLVMDVSTSNYTYVLVGADPAALDLPLNVTDMGVNLVIIMGEAGDLYASGPAMFKLNDFGNDYYLTVTVTGKVIPPDKVSPD